jgi:TetR/AcrR family transcriptional repressor of nem operon
MRYPARHKTETHRRIVAAAAGLFRERGLDAVSVADVMAAAGLTHGGFYAHFASKDELIAEALRSGRGTGADKLRRIAERTVADRTAADGTAVDGMAADGTVAQGTGADGTLTDGMVAEAAVADGAAAQPSGAERRGRALEAMVMSYLSPAHRARRAEGCVVAALGTEAGRHTPAARRALAERSHGLAQALLPYLPERGGVPRQDGAKEDPEGAKEDLAKAVTACLVGGMILARLEEDSAAADRTLAACRSFILEALG